jgi:putative sterol carrier protein
MEESMSIAFPSQEWVEAFFTAINESPEYKEGGKPWTHGVTALVVKAQPEIGVPEDYGIWLDLHEGVCREAHHCSAEEAQTAPFCITGDYARWKQVIHKELEPVKGMMQGKLKLKGNLQIIVRNVKAAQALVTCATRVPTKFLDEA